MSDKKEAPATNWRQELYDWIETLTSVLLFVVVVFIFLCIVIRVSGSSMFPTLHDGDLVFVQRIGYTPRQGDIVILRKDSFIDQAIIKRVIATEGQELEIDYDTNTVYVDGVALEEDYLNFDNGSADGTLYEAYGDDYMVEREGMTNKELIVPEGCIFVMGDNRNGSTDSRYARLDTVDTRYVIGRALGVFYPFGDAKTLN